MIDAAWLACSEAVALACGSRRCRALLASVCMGCTLIVLPGAVDSRPGPMPASLVTPTCWQPHTRAHEPPLTLVTITAGLDPSYSACLRANRQAYARRHGYEYCDFSANVAAHRAFGFQKLVALHHLFSQRKLGGLAWYLDADALVMNQSIAIDALLAIIRRNREWNEDAARTELLKIFEALGPTDEITVVGRRKLSSTLFS